MNNYFYTFKGGNLFRHNTNELRCNFYGVQYNSRIKSVLNEAPLENKIYKTLNIEGDAPWSAALETDLQNNGFIQVAWFEKKEQSWYAFVRNSGTSPASPSEYALRSVNGIGRSAVITGPPSALEIKFSISPFLVEIGSIVSIGDNLYFSLPPTFEVPIFCGVIKDIVIDYPSGDNKIIVDTTVAGGAIPSQQTSYFMYIKNSVAESHGVLGHYCVFNLENTKTSKVELFSIESEVMKSYP